MTHLNAALVDITRSLNLRNLIDSGTPTEAALASRVRKLENFVETVRNANDIAVEASLTSIAIRNALETVDKGASA